jgi:hypothetical protein
MKPARLPIVILALLLATVGFAWAQNEGIFRGGNISVPKTLWLHLTLSIFVIVPLWLWRDGANDAGAQRLGGWLLAGFAVRGAIELPMIYFTHAWRCGYGVTHDFVMLAVAIFFGARCQAPGGRWFATLFSVTLLCEAWNAWSFSRVADPSAGIYFAASAPEFQMINRITMAELAVLYPALALWLWRYVRRLP